MSGRPTVPSARRAARRALLVAAVTLASATVASCVDVSTSPDTPATIEMEPFPYPSVVLGDTLRDESGAVAGVRAIVRNLAGDPIEGVGARYLYADFNRDSALLVDETTGIVVAVKQPRGDGRIAARVGSSLQVLRPLVVTVRPDTVSGQSLTNALTTVFPDTGRSEASRNTTEALNATVRNRDGATPVNVTGWVVRFTLVRPANATNDTAAAAWLVNDNGSASVIDTTDGSGVAGRRVRVRAALFPSAGTDTVIVQATTLYRGQPVAGSGVLLKAPVIRGTPP